MTDTRPSVPVWRHAYILMTLVALFWAGNTIVGRAVVGEVPPMAISFWRTFGALLILLPFAAARMWRERATIRKHWRILTLMGVLNTTMFHSLAFIGLNHTEAVNGSLMQGTFTINVLIAGLVISGRMFSTREFAGVALGLIGTIIIIVRGDVGVLANFSINIGDPLVWAGVMSSAIFSILLPRKPPSLDSVCFMAVVFLAGTITSLPFYAIEIATVPLPELNGVTVFSIVYVALFASVLAQVFLVESVGQIGPAGASYFVYLTPVFGIVMAVALLGEVFAWHHAVGIVLIFGGIGLATYKAKAS